MLVFFSHKLLAKVISGDLKIYCTILQRDFKGNTVLQSCSTAVLGSHKIIPNLIWKRYFLVLEGELMVVWISTEQVKTQQPPISSSVLLKLDKVLRQVLVEYSYSPLLVRTSSRDPGQGRRRRRRRRRGGAAVRGDISHTLLLCLHVRQTGITNQVLHCRF